MILAEAYKDDDYIHDQDKKALSLGWDLSESDICDKFQTIQKDVLIVRTLKVFYHEHF